MSLTRLLDLALILTAVWGLMFVVFVTVEGVVVPLEPVFDGYGGVLVTSILKVAASAMIILGWLAVWDWIAARYYRAASRGSRL